MSANPGQPQGAGASRGVWLAGGCLILLIAGLAIFLSNQGHQGQNDKPGKAAGGVLPVAECERIAGVLNEAIANLENNQLSKADAALSDLAQALPLEPAAVRNLAICRALSIDGMSPEISRQDPVAAKAAIEAATRLEPKSPVPHILAARIAKRQEDIATALAELRVAGELAHNAATWYELYTLREVVLDDDSRQTGRTALDWALEADPENSFLLKQQIVARAEEKDKRVLETLTALRTQIEPILPGIKQRLRADFDELAQQLTTAVEEEKWPQVVARSRMIDNIIKAEEWIKSDLRKLEPHMLSFVVHGLSSTKCSESGTEAGAASSMIAVHFQEAPSDRRIPKLEGVKAVNLSDFNLDGTADVIALTDRELAVLAQTGGAKSWQNMLTAHVREPMRGLLVADLDPIHDVRAKLAASPGGSGKPPAPGAAKSGCQIGDLEVVVFGPAGVQVFGNSKDENGNRILAAVEQHETLEGIRNVLAGVVADIDHDGDLDLVFSAEAGISIWSNQGQLKFTDVTKRSALPPKELAATSLVAVDWDRDLDIDILVSGPGDAPAGWLENLRHGSFRWRSFEKDLAGVSGSTSLNVLDVDGNASWDILGVGPKGIHLARTRTSNPGIAESLDVTEISKESFVGSLVGDFDNDTHSDLLAWGPARVKFFQGTPSAKFLPVEDFLKRAPSIVVACSATDIDGNGGLDLVVAEEGKSVLYDNLSGNQNHWLALRTVGADGSKQGDVNPLAVGSLAEVKTGQRYQAQVVTGQITHFGLGKKKSADVLRVVWTNGIPQPVVAPQTDVSLCRIHDPGGSCPYFYTWDGTKFVFCTDACWAAPLGLQLAEGVFAEPRAWEYLSIPEGRLAPKEGKYLVQMTEELWEAAYLDRMELIAVDHPADVEIFSNEKVGPAELAQFKIHTVRQRRLPAAARDKHGRDVLDQIAREDSVFMKGFDDEPRRGLADEHFLELDLGPLGRPKQVTLFLTGWLYPSSTSLNVGVSQDLAGPAARPPALEVPDQHGQWQVVRPFMGFPGGKTKTIAVDLSGVFLTNDFRLRIVTNMEFFWDAAFFSVDEKPAPLELARLSVASADLHYRGFSNIVRTTGFGPDWYDYANVSRSPKWAPMAGRFTRYGDVTELLQEEDDLQVVFGSGDELTVEFNVLDHAPPSGWTRDFLLHNVGWDKDNDLNVVTSQAVEPLPFHGMSGYPYRPDEQFPDTLKARDYLRKYQTRVQRPIEFWRQVQRFGRN